MEIISVFGILAAIIFIGFIAEVIFRKTNIPDVLILILLGILIGPVYEFVSPDSFGFSAQLFTTFALVFILFQGALSIDFKTLFRSLSSAIELTIFTFILTVLMVTGVGMLLGFAWEMALLLGMILGGTSSAIVIPLVKNIDISEKYGLSLNLESAISDVLCIIGTITIIDILIEGQIVASGVFKNVLSSFSLALIVGTIAGLIWIFLLRKFDVLVNAYMLTIAIVIGLYAFVQSPFVEASGPIAALAFGLILGNSRSILSLKDNGENNQNGKEKKTHNSKNNKNGIDKAAHSRVNVLSPFAKNFYAEISFFVKVFFFVYLGILMDFSNPTVFLYGAILTLAIYLVRPFVVKIVFRNDGYLDNKQKAFLESLIPKGLAAAVLVQLAVQSGVLGDLAGEMVSLVLSVVLLSIVFTSLLVFFTEKGWFKGFYPFLKITKKEGEEKKSSK